MWLIGSCDRSGERLGGGQRINPFHAGDNEVKSEVQDTSWGLMAGGSIICSQPANNTLQRGQPHCSKLRMRRGNQFPWLCVRKTLPWILKETGNGKNSEDLCSVLALPQNLRETLVKFLNHYVPQLPLRW